MAHIEFHGAAKVVTGSNYVVRTKSANFVVDCGMFQGPNVEALNLEDLAYDASEIDFVLLTHTHIDHSGMIPKLFKHGFNGPVYATHHTIQIATLLLLDSAKIQENNYQQGLPYGSYTPKVGYAYNTADAEKAIASFKSVDFRSPFKPTENIEVEFVRAGHVLGAASILVTIKDEDNKKLLFSGDIGRVEQPLIESFDVEFQSKPDYIFIESLYGGIKHPNRADSVTEMLDEVNQTIARGGSVFFPVFSVQRAQELMHDFKTAIETGVLSADIPVWLDSPLAQSVSKIYTAALQNTPDSLFDFPNLRYVKKYRQSQSLSRKRGQIILAGSGMASGGRILSHLAVALRNPRNSVIFVGYQAEGTLGREMVEGAKSVVIGGTNVPVRSKITYMHGFSAHGDTTDYESWVTRFVKDNDSLKKMYLVHAEPEKAEALKHEFLNDLGVEESKMYIPGMGDKFEI